MLRAAALLTGAALMLASCGAPADDGDATRTGELFADCAANPNTCNSAAPGDLRQGGELTVAVEQNIPNWNLLSAEGNLLYTGLVLKGVLPSAFYTQPDLTPAMNENLLESAEMTSTDPQTIVYQIKDNARWSDGTPISASDFVYNWQVQNGRDCPACAAATSGGYEQLESVVGSPDGKTVTATFATPYTDWRALWGLSSPLYPAHIAAQQGDLATPEGLAESFTWFGTTVPEISGGPYRVDNFQNNQSVTLVPNPEWYGPIPHLDRLIFRIITDSTQIPLALQNNEVQVIYPQPQLDLVQQVRNIPGVSASVGLGLTWEHVDLNLNNPALADPPVRQAMFTAIDRQAIIDKTVGQFTDGLEPLNNHNYVPQQDAYEDVISDTGQGAGNGQRAQQILTDAGYQIQGGQLINPEGQPVPPLRIRYTAGNQIRQTQSELIAQQMQPLGIQVQVVPTNDLPATLSQGDYDIMVFAWVASPFPFSGAQQNWTTGSASNYGGYSNPEVDRLIAAAATNTDETAAAELLNQANRIMAADAYVLPLYQKPTFIATYDNVANVRDNSSLDGPLYNVHEWGLRAP